ncbi:TetR/AcrR family transcriptional regulator [Amycolatopsis sp. A133]|uniref:TetR/AcrR family transcriptional regulator n=1 Tax=Amycolatopsis sp. A133 TaxID=3064472 RepID=UPI0027EDEE1D|nr:TetR/AcrR family transcriptional regulator [Amycolatopsis sp. A133]MDQ7807310.1 TetR/AcrR family transcriptional regulator [Amycolatopsis sp. A133]
MSYSTDPRAARSREAMIAAARRLLAEEGLDAVTHRRVAEEAGVGRATVYRHWPRADQLLLDAMGGADLPLFKDPEAPLHPWLCRQLRRMADELAIPSVAAVSLTLAQSALSDPEAAHRQDESVRTITDRLRAAVESAVAAGELTTDAEPADLTAMLVGPIVYRATAQRRPSSDAFIERLVDSVGTWRS